MRSVVHTWRSFVRVTMEGTSQPFGLSNTAEVIRKRINRASLKERRRKDKFISRYLEIKYPDIYKEAMKIYKALTDKYPGRADVTKTYYFKKWEEKNKCKQQSQLYVPYLPILTDLPNTTNVEIIEGQQPQQEETPDQAAPQEETVEEEQEEPMQEHEEVQQTPPQEDTVHTGMTLDEMSIAVEEIVKALQSDSDVMDIVENFDLPDGVWDNELAIPDYVLEGDLDW